MPGGIAAHHPPGEDHLARQLAALRAELRRLRAGPGTTAGTTTVATAARFAALPTEARLDSVDPDDGDGLVGTVLALPVDGPVRVTVECDQVLIDPGDGTATAGLAWGVEDSPTAPLVAGPGPRSALLRTEGGAVGGSLHRSGTAEGGVIVAQAWVRRTDPAAAVSFGPCTLRVEPL